MSPNFRMPGVISDRLPRDLLVYQWSDEDLFPIPDSFQLLNTATNQPVTFDIYYRVSRGTFQYAVGHYDDSYIVVELQPDGDAIIIQDDQAAQKIFDVALEIDEIREQNGERVREDRSHFLMAGRNNTTYEVRMKAILPFENQWYAILEAWNNPEENLTFRFGKDEIGPAYLMMETSEHVIRGVVREYFKSLEESYSTGRDHFDSYSDDDSDLFG